MLAQGLVPPPHPALHGLQHFLPHFPGAHRPCPATPATGQRTPVGAPRPPAEGSRAYVTCEDCGKEILETSIHTHRRRYHKQLQEPVLCCGQWFPTRWHLSAHRRSAHTRSAQLHPLRPFDALSGPRPAGLSPSALHARSGPGPPSPPALHGLQHLLPHFPGAHRPCPATPAAGQRTPVGAPRPPAEGSRAYVTCEDCGKEILETSIHTHRRRYHKQLQEPVLCCGHPSAPSTPSPGPVLPAFPLLPYMLAQGLVPPPHPALHGLQHLLPHFPGAHRPCPATPAAGQRTPVGAPRPPAEGSRAYVTCEDCGKEILETSIHTHRRRYHKQLQEPVLCCGQWFPTRWHLSAHRRSAHTRSAQLHAIESESVVSLLDVQSLKSLRLQFGSADPTTTKRAEAGNPLGILRPKT
ncbi:replication initiator 1-like [Penaeus indicus]|uniref:replication initiator 1-like n=1 Tax=Penaeus indicus TaxID=29960 RepID=UPI00300D83AC